MTNPFNYAIISHCPSMVVFFYENHCVFDRPFTCSTILVIHRNIQTKFITVVKWHKKLDCNLNWKIPQQSENMCCNLSQLVFLFSFVNIRYSYREFIEDIFILMWIYLSLWNILLNRNSEKSRRKYKVDKDKRPIAYPSLGPIKAKIIYFQVPQTKVMCIPALTISS